MLYTFGVSHDQIRMAFSGVMASSMSQVQNGKGNLNCQLCGRTETEEKLQKVLEGLRLSDSFILSKKSHEEIVMRITSMYQLKAAPTIATTQIRPSNSSQVGYLSGQHNLTTGAVVRYSNSSQRASSMGNYPDTASIQYGANVVRAAGTNYATAIQSDRTFGESTYNRATIGGYPSASSGVQPVIANRGSTYGITPATSTRPTNVITSGATYTTGQIATNQYQPSTLFGGATTIRQESTRQTIPSGTYCTQPQALGSYSNQIRAARGSGTSSMSHQSNQPQLAINPYAIRPPQVINAGLQQTTAFDSQATIRDLTEQLRKERAENANLMNRLTNFQKKISEEELHIKQAVEMEAHSEQDKLGIMSKEYEAKIQRVHNEDEKVEESLRKQIRSLEEQVSTLQDNIIDYQKTCDQLTGQIKVKSCEQEVNQTQLHGQLSEERKETVKMRDLILEQNTLISELKADINKRNYKIETLTTEMMSKGQEIGMYKSLVEETTRKLQQHLEENRALKQQTQIQEYTTKEIVAQNNLEQSNLVKKIYRLESQLRAVSQIEGGDSPTGGDSPLKNSPEGGFGGFHIQATSSSQVEGFIGDANPINVEIVKGSSQLSSSEIIENLASFLKSSATNTPTPEKALEMNAQLGLLATHLKVIGSRPLMKSFDSMSYSRGTSEQSKVQDQGDAKPASSDQVQAEPQKLIALMAHYLSNPNKLRKATQEDVDMLTQHVSQLSDSIAQVDKDRERLKQQSEAYFEQVAIHVNKIDSLEKQNQARLDEIANLKVREAELQKQVNTLEESQVLMGKTDSQMSQEVSFEDLQKKLSVLEDTEKKLKRHLASKEEEVEQQATLIEQLSISFADKEKSIVQELTKDINALQSRLELVEIEKSQLESREKATANAYLEQIASLTKKIDESTKEHNAQTPKRIEALTMARDVEKMEFAATQLQTLVSTQAASPDTKQKANQLLVEVSQLCLKVSATGTPAEKREAEKVEKLAAVVSHSNFRSDSLDNLSKAILELKTSVLSEKKKEEIPAPQPARPIAPGRDTLDQSAIIDNLNRAVFELDQSRAGLAQQNSQLMIQISHLHERLKEAEEHSIRSSHMSHSHAHSPQNTDHQQTQKGSEKGESPSHLIQVSLMAKKLHDLQVSSNLKLMAHQIQNAGSASKSPHPDAQIEMVTGFNNVSKLASSVGSSSRTNPKVSEHLERISTLAQQLSTKAQSTKAVQGTPMSATDEIQLTEIQHLISQVESIHGKAMLEESLSVRDLPEDAGQPAEFITLKDSIANLEELLAQRDEELIATNQKAEELASIVAEFEEKQRTSSALTAQFGKQELEEVEHKVFDLEQSNAGLAQENNQLRNQLKHLHERIREVQSERELLRQQTGTSSKYQGQTIQSQGMELGSSQISDLSGTPYQIKPSEESGDVGKMLGQVADLTKRISEQEKELAAKNEQNIALQSELQKMASFMKKLEEDVKHKESEISESRESSSKGIKELKHTISSHEVELTTKSGELQLSQSQISELNRKLAQAFEDIRRVESEKAEIESMANSQISLLQSEVDNLKMELTRSKSSGDVTSSLKSQIDYLSSQLSQTGDISEREKRLAEEIRKVQKDREAIEKEKKEIIDLQNQVLDRNESRLRKYSEQSNEQDLLIRVDKLEKDLKDAKDDRKKTENKLKDAENAKKLVDIELLETRKQREKSDKTYKEKFDKLEKKCIDLEKDVKIKDSTIDKLDTENTKLHDQIKALKEELKNLKSDLLKYSQVASQSDSVVIEGSLKQTKLAEKEVKDSDVKKTTETQIQQSKDTKKTAEQQGNEIKKSTETSSQQGKDVKKTAETSAQQGKDTKKTAETSTQQGGETKKSKKAQKEENRKLSEANKDEATLKSSQVKIQDENSSSKKTQSKKDGARKVSHNDAGSWMESEDSEDPNRLFKSYVPPASLIKQVHDVDELKDSKASDKKSSKNDSKVEVKNQGKSEGRTQGKTEGQSQGQSQRKAEGQYQGQSQRKAEGQYQGKAESQYQGKVEGQSQGQSQGKAEGQSQAQSQRKAEGQSQGQYQRKAEGQYQGKAEGQYQGKAEGQYHADLKTEGKSQVKAEGKSRGKTQGKYDETYEEMYEIKGEVKSVVKSDVRSEGKHELRSDVKTERNEEALSSHRDHETSRAQKGEDTSRYTRDNKSPPQTMTESQVSKRSKVSDSRGAKSKRSGRGRQYEEDEENEYYVRKSDTYKDELSEYIEKPKESAKREERGSKTKRETTGEYTDRQEQPTSSPTRFQKEEKRTVVQSYLEPTHVDSEFVAKRKEHPTQHMEMELDKRGLHFSVQESPKRAVKKEIIVMAKSQQNPYTSPLLRAEDFIDYHDNDGLIKVSDYSMDSFEVEDLDREKLEDENDDIEKNIYQREKKSTIVGKDSTKGEGNEAKKKKKKKGKSTASGNEPLSQEREWLERIVMK